MSTLFIGEGRLGNQVIQYVAMLTMLGQQKIITPNLLALSRVFKPTDDIRHVYMPKMIEQLIRKIIAPIILRPLFRCLRFGNYCTELNETLINGAIGSSGKAKITKGLLPITFVDGGFYQNFTDFLKPEYFRKLAIRDDVLGEARNLVGILSSGRSKPEIVMHVRRGDYIGHATYGLTNVVLTEEYFRMAAKSARDYLGVNAVILIVTDEPAWVETFLAEVKPFIVVSNTEAVDFALLTMFKVAILSNSTFSLAAACVSDCVEHVIGPKYWFGHSVGEWYPPRIRVEDERFVYV